MDPESYSLLFITFISLLFLSAFFSSAEVAFLSLSEVDLKALRKKAAKRSKRAVQLWNNHHTFFIAIRFALLVTQVALVCTVIFLSKSVAVFLDVSHALALVLMLSFFAITVFMINEILAKFVLKKNCVVAEFLSLPAMVYFTLVRPFIGLLDRLFQFFSNMLDVSRLDDGVVQVELVEQVEALVDPDLLDRRQVGGQRQEEREPRENQVDRKHHVRDGRREDGAQLPSADRQHVAHGFPPDAPPAPVFIPSRSSFP